MAIGKVKVPGGPANFYRYRAEITMADWLGPGRGRIDPKKEADASDANLAGGRTNLSIEASEQGQDARDILMGRARDKAMIAEFGLEGMIGHNGGPPMQETAAQDEPEEAEEDQ